MENVLQNIRRISEAELKQRMKHGRPISKEEFYKRVRESINAKKLKSQSVIDEVPSEKDLKKPQP